MLHGHQLLATLMAGRQQYHAGSNNQKVYMSGCWFHLVNLLANIRKKYTSAHFYSKKKQFRTNLFNYLFPLIPVFRPNNLSYVRSPYISHFASFLEAPYCNIATQRIIRNAQG
jgi:hypothetical protein